MAMHGPEPPKESKNTSFVPAKWASSVMAGASIFKVSRRIKGQICDMPPGNWTRNWIRWASVIRCPSSNHIKSIQILQISAVSVLSSVGISPGEPGPSSPPH